MNILNIWFQYKHYYCSNIPVLNWKMLVRDFWQGLILYQKSCFLFKKWKLPGAPTNVGLTIFPWHFAHMLYVALPKYLVWIFLFCFCFVFLRSTNSGKIQCSSQLFVGIAKENTRAQFSEKNKLCYVETLKKFDLFRQNTKFLVSNKSFSKINIYYFITKPTK